MIRTGRAIVLLAVQAALVLSIAGKYLYERKVCPRVWVRAAQYDPNLPMRGRYLALQLAVDACALPRDNAHHTAGYIMSNPPDLGFWRWTVRPVVQNGKLVPVLASATDRPELTDEVTIWGRRPCDRAILAKNVEYFIADTAKSPFPLKPGEELWVEVTVPPMGPPRPIQLALAKNGAFTPLDLR
jgi:hypothetical protein